ncbi:helix-turn-helix transcriptional regulator [Bacteroides sp. UBA939]|uniref:helix-turn-helix transcriptional regulator n=1 Tax=Bacteroides sp. UBA939 TaxID=1946092 RepID=UPI0025C2F4E8|nr:response regulator transcription factor [Bacteroides sp. UBA939]
MIAPEIAIVDSNTLSCLGLQNLLEEIIPMAVIRVFSSFEELVDDTPDMYAHYFISAQIYFKHTAFFLPRRPQTIVLANGDSQPQLAGIPTLNIYQDEKTLIRNILQLHQYGHRSGHPNTHPHSAAGHPGNHPCGTSYAGGEHILSPREIEVLVLVTKGLINKEIADKLNISLTTVISHRRNITEKLGIKSVAGLTIYAVMHGYVEADSI